MRRIEGSKKFFGTSLRHTNATLLDESELHGHNLQSLPQNTRLRKLPDGRICALAAGATEVVQKMEIR
jgi:transcriptional regulator of met regulon